MVSDALLLDRTIDTFPHAFKTDFTPYKLTDFSSNTEEYCMNARLLVPEIKMSKVIVLGDVAVGKTCLVNRFCHQSFNANYKATIGVDFEVEQFQILGVPFHLQIWDTAGQERFKCIAQSYYRCANVIVIVFDLSAINSLRGCKVWLQEALQTSSKDPHIFLVGTKKDLVSPASYNEIEYLSTKVADVLNAEFWAVSSHTGTGVRDLFVRIAALTFDALIAREQRIRTIPISNNDIISLKKTKQSEKTKRTSCCK